MDALVGCSRGQGIWDKLCFSCEIAQCGKALISIFQQFSVSIKKAFGLGEDWALGYNLWSLEIFVIFPYFLSFFFLCGQSLPSGKNAVGISCRWGKTNYIQDKKFMCDMYTTPSNSFMVIWLSALCYVGPRLGGLHCYWWGDIRGPPGAAVGALA